MIPRVLLGTAQVPGGGELRLLQRGAEFSIMLGAKTEEQLRRNLAATALTLPEDAVRTLDEASRPVMPYPYWHQANQASRSATVEI